MWAVLGGVGARGGPDIVARQLGRPERVGLFRPGRHFGGIVRRPGGVLLARVAGVVFGGRGVRRAGFAEEVGCHVGRCGRGRPGPVSEVSAARG